MALGQLGAEVIRVDPPGGGSDAGRWPLSHGGASLFWANLNKGKRSVTIDHRSAEGESCSSSSWSLRTRRRGLPRQHGGREAASLRASWRARRTDVIHVHVEGRRNGKPAVDYSINAEVGVPLMTGPAEAAVPVNHVLPAWDLVTGMLAASAVTSCACTSASAPARVPGSRSRSPTSRWPVSPAWAGWRRPTSSGTRAPRVGNHMFGSFGVDFATADGRRIMVVALTEGQWKALRRVTGTERVFAALEETLDADLDREGDRYRLRETIASVLRPWFAARDFATLEKVLDDAKVLWSPYRDMAEIAAAATVRRDAIVSEIDQPGVGPMLGGRRRGAGTGSTPRRAGTVLSADTDGCSAACSASRRPRSVDCSPGRRVSHAGRPRTRSRRRTNCGQ